MKTNCNRKGVTTERNCFDLSLHFFFIAFISLLFLTGCQSTSGQSQKNSDHDQNARTETTDDDGGELKVPVKKARKKTMPFNLYGMSCSKCAETAEEALESMDGVVNAKVMLDSKTGWIQYRAGSGMKKEKIRQKLKKTGKGFTAVFPGEKVPDKYRKQDTESEDKTHKIDEKLISKREKVNLENHLVKGKYTIIDYYAKWCRGCQLLEPKLQKLAKKRGDIAIRRINIVSWSSPAATQAIKKYKMGQIPYLRVYGKDGSFLGEVMGNDVQKVKSLISGRGSSKASGKKPGKKTEKTSEKKEHSKKQTQEEKKTKTYVIKVTGMR